MEIPGRWSDVGRTDASSTADAFKLNRVPGPGPMVLHTYSWAAESRTGSTGGRRQTLHDHARSRVKPFPERGPEIPQGVYEYVCKILQSSEPGDTIKKMLRGHDDAVDVFFQR
jgi:hypothetical protein